MKLPRIPFMRQVCPSAQTAAAPVNAGVSATSLAMSNARKSRSLFPANGLMQNAPVLYHSDRARTLWLLLPVTLAPLIVTACLLTRVSDVQLLEEFGSVGAALAWKAGLILLSSILFWPLLWLSGRYVTQVEHVGRQRLRVTVWSLTGARETEWKAAFSGGEFHAGKLVLPYTPIVNAPWTGYRTPEGKKLVVDAQGDFPFGEETLEAAMTQLPP